MFVAVLELGKVFVPLVVVLDLRTLGLDHELAVNVAFELWIRHLYEILQVLVELAVIVHPEVVVVLHLEVAVVLNLEVQIFLEVQIQRFVAAAVLALATLVLMMKVDEACKREDMLCLS